MVLGLGEQEADRVGLLHVLATLPEHPESVPINMLVRVAGTPLEVGEDVDPFEFIRIIAVARIMMPASHVRLSAGREDMNEQTQALAFLAGANSIFYGEQLLIAVDQEGGRVQRIRPPIASNYPDGATIGSIYRKDRDAGLRAAWSMSKTAKQICRWAKPANC